MTDKSPNPIHAKLCDADAAVLDAILEARAVGVDTSQGGPMPPGSAERAATMHNLLELLSLDQLGNDEQPTDGEFDVLTADVVEAVAARRQRQRFAEQVQVFAEPRRTAGVAWRQVMTAAAVFLIGLSLLLPVLNNSKNKARQAACAASMGSLGNGLADFAISHNGTLPRYDVAPDTPWWRVGQSDNPANIQSNSANLYRLVRQGFAEGDLLNCPSNEHAPKPGSMTAHKIDYDNHQQVSYSYQNQFRPEPIRLTESAPVIALLADKNPLFVIVPGKFSQDADVALTAPSVVHGSRGQNVLRSDGSVQWVIRPVFEDGQRKDNIWTASGVERHTGTEVPADPADSFLVP